MLLLRIIVKYFFVTAKMCNNLRLPMWLKLNSNSNTVSHNSLGLRRTKKTWSPSRRAVFQKNHDAKYLISMKIWKEWKDRNGDQIWKQERVQVSWKKNGKSCFPLFIYSCTFNQSCLFFFSKLLDFENLVFCTYVFIMLFWNAI